jgi:hypothetical protein
MGLRMPGRDKTLAEGHGKGNVDHATWMNMAELSRP